MICKLQNHYYLSEELRETLTKKAMETLTPPPYIIEQFERDRKNSVMTDSVFLYWKGCLCSLLSENGKRYSIAQLVERVKKELEKEDTKMFKSQAIKMINL